MRLARVSLGDPISVDMLPRLQAALLSSELFRSVTVWLEDTPRGVILVTTIDDKHSWVAAPTLHLLPDSWSIGLGYAENNLFGEDKKVGQLCGVRNTRDVVDASVVLCARTRKHRIVTSDPDDLRRLDANLELIEI
jgi:hypothetical protein